MKKKEKKLKKALEKFFDVDLGDESINQGHYFEVMDRTHVIQCTIDDFINSHPAINRPGIDEAIIKRKLSEVQDLLTEVYQWSSNKWDDFD